jgi:hypothetical protein
MIPSDDTTQTRILMKIAEDIGETKADIGNLKDNVDALTANFQEVKEKVGQSMTRRECLSRHTELKSDLAVMKDSLVKEIKKVPTGEQHPVVTKAMIKEASIPSIEEVEEALEIRREEKAGKRRETINSWLTVILTSSAVLTGGAVGIYKLVGIINKLETAVINNTGEMKAKLDNVQTRVVFVNKDTSNDAGISNYNNLISSVPERPANKKAAAKKAK